VQLINGHFKVYFSTRMLMVTCRSLQSSWLTLIHRCPSARHCLHVPHIFSLVYFAFVVKVIWANTLANMRLSPSVNSFGCLVNISYFLKHKISCCNNNKSSFWNSFSRKNSKIDQNCYLSKYERTVRDTIHI